MTSPLLQAAEAAQSWIDRLPHTPVGARRSLADLQRDFDAPLPQQGRPAGEVLDELIRLAEPGLLGSAGGRFFAWVIGGGLDSALAADWLVSAWDQNAALAACGPSVSVIEDVAGRWIKELLDLPREASFAFTTGCQMAHATALAAARVRVLRQAGWDLAEDGLFGAPPVTVFTSQDRHGSVWRAARLLGFGNRQIVALPSAADGTLRPDTLEQALAAAAGPAIVVLNAADLNIGAFDPFSQLIPLAKAAGAWVHVDGAFGLLARASRTHRARTEGVELADSWATDGHKWLNVPFDCGIAVLRDREAHREAMTVTASYVAPQAGARDQIDWNPEWSRRARGVPVYAALRELGASGVEALVDRCCAHAVALVAGLGALPGVRVLWAPTLNQGLVRFEAEGRSAAQNDACTDAVIAAVNATGEAFFSGTSWRGRRAMRVSVVNWRTTDEDVRRAVAAVAAVLAQRGSVP
jgi:glutamate/tyrosine decarboxylase-like PLP-dependent enzyme